MVLLRGTLFIHLLRARKLYNADGLFRFSKNKSDPYVKVKVGNTTVAKTRVLQNTLEPKWDEYYLIEMCHEGETLDLQVLDEDLVGEDDLGILQIPIDRLIDRKQIEGEYCLTRKGRKCTGRIQFNVTFYGIDELDRTRAVQNCYFEQRRNCKVTLYQDACADSNDLTDALGYKRARAFDDITAALEGAKDFIYITGWSVKATTKLKRGEDGPSLGELLKSKAEDGVKVLILVWNEVTSTSITPGLMGTYDQETLQYFAGSRVKCVLISREKASANILESSVSATVYSHHQKTVICDTAGSYIKRRVIAFVGGLDLTEGRYDTPEHCLFQTLNTTHDGDFYNASASLENTACGPRQPWHDIHAKLEGAAALDIKQNFEERWRLQSENSAAELLELHELAYDLEHKYHGDDRWNVQIFRSISDQSALFGEKRKELLTRRMEMYYESTIHKAYVHHIRRAKRFIYIENQYFLGSCHMWNRDTGPEKAVQLIPITITMRIIDAINNGEEFSVYIVIPLHPEGEPGAAAIQEMLWYQYSTISMMYGFIADALKAVGSDNLPTDYLSFFCLGKRETSVPDDLEVPGEGTKEEALRKSGRFMIYVHSKMAIFDDEYIIVGSANINQRSMSGKRDTEIAMGACQANKKCETVGFPNGEVAKFRKSLFIEHLNKRDAVWEDTPETPASVRAVREEALNNWNSYVSESDQPNGHLLLYPFEVTADGQVSTTTEYFPDTEAKIIGSEDALLVEKITT